MLILGSRNDLQVRAVDFARGEGVSLLYASDLHLAPWTRHIVRQLVASVAQVQPDIVVLGGDLVDLRQGLPLLADCVRALAQPVYAVAGNHDVLVGESSVRDAVLGAGGRWLDDVQSLSPGITLSGTLVREARFSILCAHDPCIFPQAVQSGFDLVLAGHLHGGQVVFSEHAGRWYPGAWGYCWNGPRFEAGTTTMLVSRGVNDTLPLRWNCPREVLLCRF